MNTAKPVIILLGPQGSGKGTQGKRLAEKLGIPYLETGQLLRNEIATNSERGQFFGSIMNSGGHLEDKDVGVFMADKIQEACAKFGGVLVDGYPRSLGQVAAFEAVVKPTHVLLIDITDQEAIRRLSARWQCPKDKKNYNLLTNPPKNDMLCDDCQTPLVQRVDDTPAGIQKRLDWYHNDTQPVLDSYEKQGLLHRIDGMPEIEEVWQAVSSIPSFTKEGEGGGLEEVRKSN